MMARSRRQAWTKLALGNVLYLKTFGGVVGPRRMFMRRREFIVILGGAAPAWLTAHAQPTGRQRRIDMLMPFAKGDPEGEARSMALQQGLEQLGWKIGRSVRIEYHWDMSDVEKVEAAIAELLTLAPDVIITSTSQSVAALQRATRTVPIVFVTIY